MCCLSLSVSGFFFFFFKDSLRKLIGSCSRATVISWFSKVGGEWGTEWRIMPWLLMPSALGAPKSGMWGFWRQQDLSGCWNPFHHGQWPWHIVWKELCRMQSRWTGGSHKWSEKMGQETRSTPRWGGLWRHLAAFCVQWCSILNRFLKILTFWVTHVLHRIHDASFLLYTSWTYSPFLEKPASSLKIYHLFWLLKFQSSNKKKFPVIDLQAIIISSHSIIVLHLDQVSYALMISSFHPL